MNSFTLRTFWVSFEEPRLKRPSIPMLHPLEDFLALFHSSTDLNACKEAVASVSA